MDVLPILYKILSSIFCDKVCMYVCIFKIRTLHLHYATFKEL